jgi:hypothetical protein
MKETADVAVDRWMRVELSSAYNRVLDEPIPDELLRVLDTATAE